MMNTFSPTPPDEDQKHLANSSLPFLTENEAEVARLMLQHRRLTELMGNAVPPRLDLSRVHRALDVGCGVGAWIYEMAWRHPGSFDLIHMRFLVGDVTVQAFPSLLRSLAHLCRPGGFFVWTEAEFPLTTSPACQHLFSLVLHALQAAGRAFAPGYSLGITSCMGRWLRDAGYRIAQDQAYAIEVSAGTKGHEMFARQAYVFGNQVQPFLLETKATTATEFEEVFTQMQKEIRDESFCGLCFLRTVVGVKL